MTAASPQVIIRDMLTPEQAVDDYLGALASRNYAPRTLANYRRTLDLFCATLPERIDVSEISEAHCRRFLARRPQRVARYAAGTRGQDHAALAGLFRWLYRKRKLERDPLEFIDPPVRQRPEDVEVVTVSSRDAERLLAEARRGSWSERLAVELALYLGPRRSTLARLTLADYNQAEGELRFREKGQKTSWKLIPDALRQTLDAAIAAGELREPDDYLVPPRKGGQLRRRGERDDRVIWRLVKDVAARAGVNAHVHALRAAFATYCAEQGMSRESVQELLGHRNPSTTEVYFRGLDRRKLMEPVRTLQWRLGDALTDPLESSHGVGAGGFEPPLQAEPPDSGEDLLRRHPEGPVQ